jgi:aminoglycoside phosphotransferase (APT) family kinase protein
VTTVYSQRLGPIRDDQFAAALARFDLGDFVAAAPTTSGLFGQNAFVTSTRGEFVLRGAPHWVRDRGARDYRPEDRWQFAKEAFFVERLHERTHAPVPWPYRRDTSSDIFGWPYVLMPRMPGRCFGDRDILEAVDADGRRAIAAALGENLAEMQRLTWPFAGDFDTRTIELTPFAGGAVRAIIDETRGIVAESDANGSMTSADTAWIEALIADARGAEPTCCTYVHCDYKLNNLTVVQDGADYRVGGLLDFHEARFSDGLIDIVRQACGYLDTEPALARTFVESYARNAPIDRNADARLPLCVVNDRMKFWGYFTRPEINADWTRGKTFRGWAQRYVDALTTLVR